MKNTYSRRLWSAARFLPAFVLGGLLAAAPVSPALAQPNWQWAAGSNSLTVGSSIAHAEQTAVDAAGDVYVTGWFQGPV